MKLSTRSLGLIGMLILLANLWSFHSILLGSIGLICFFISLGQACAQKLPANIPSFRNYWGMLVAGLVTTSLTTVTYYIWAMNSWSISLILICLSLFIAFSPKKIIPLPKISISLFPKISLFPIAIAVGLLVTLIANRTTDILISPWQTLSPWFFIAYAIGIASSLYTLPRLKKSWQQASLISLYLFISFSVAAIIYLHGFGFDGFIHRATQEWIVNNGFIEPKTPYYIGQYSLIAFLSLLSAIPVFYLDIFFVPILAALLIPPAVMYAYKQQGLPTWFAAASALFVPFLYFITLNLTTPHNVVLLLFIITIFALISALQKRLPFVVVLGLALVACLVHPLLGAPLLLFSLSAWVYQRFPYKKTVLAAFILIMAIVPSVMFSLNNFLGGFPFPELVNPLQKTNLFLSLFDRPYWYSQTSTFILDWLYRYQLLIAPITIGLALVASISIKKKSSIYLLWSGFVSFVIAAWLLRTWLYFPNVAQTEQTNYPWRLLWASVLFILPLAPYGLYICIEKIKGYTFAKTSIAIFVGILLMISLYFSYPQRNPKVFFPGYNVTDADFHAAEWIHERQGDNDNYIVLSNALTSVAALSRYSFYKHFQTEQGELFYYAIPTGGPLYGYYAAMLYEGQKNTDMQAALELSGAQTGYFVVSHFWSKYNDIVAGAKQSADEWHSIDNGKMHIFIYNRDTSE